MKRKPEPELMQNLLQVKAYSEADFFASDKSFIFNLDCCLRNKKKNLDENSLIFDLGCGPGNISQLLALEWPVFQVVGLDASASMIAMANKRKTKLIKNKSIKLSYEHLDVGLISNGMEEFAVPGDVIVSNSLLHHLSNPQDLWRASKKLGQNGSLIFHRDLRRPDSYQEAVQLQRTYLPECPEVLKEDFLASLQAAYTVDEVIEQLKTEDLEHFQVLLVDDRYLEVSGIL